MRADDATRPRDVAAGLGLGPRPASTPREAASAFEALVVKTMLSAMRSSESGDDPLASTGGDFARDMLDEVIADGIARAGGFGLADQIAAEMAAEGPPQGSPRAADRESRNETGDLPASRGFKTGEEP